MEEAKDWLADKWNAFSNWVTGDDEDDLINWRDWEVPFEKVVLHERYRGQGGECFSACPPPPEMDSRASE